jgi:thymidylate kinase
VSEIAKLFPIVQPDLRVILTLNEEARRERIKQRGELDARDKEIRQAGSRLDFFETFLLEHSAELMKVGKAMRIDTALFNPQQVAQQIIDHLLNAHLVKSE